MSKWQVVKNLTKLNGAYRSTTTYDGLTLGEAQEKFRTLIALEDIIGSETLVVRPETPDGEQAARFTYSKGHGSRVVVNISLEQQA